MPLFSTSPFDRRADALRASSGGAVSEPGPLPGSGWQAVARGARNLCPKCRGAALFARFLKPMAVCPACAEDWSHQRADDFPAYVAILLTGHLVAPAIIMLVRKSDLGAAALVAIILPLTITLLILLLQPAKGAIIALQWWLGMHGFEDRSAALSGNADTREEPDPRPSGRDRNPS